MDLDPINFDIILIDLIPSILFLLLECFLIIKSLSNKQNLVEEARLSINSENQINEENDFLTMSFYVQYKLSLLLALLYLIDIIYTLFFETSGWWINKESYLIYLYFLAIIAWIISSKQIKWISDKNPLFFNNLRVFWLMSLITHLLQFFFHEKYEILTTLLLKIISSLVLSFYALNKEEKNLRLKAAKPAFYRFIEYIISKFEENFYLRVIFLGKDYEKFLRKEIELSDLEVHSNLYTNLSFSEVKKKEKALIKKLTEKNYLNELEEQEFLTYLPSIQILILKEPESKLPNPYKNYDPMLFFVVYSYLTWDVDNRLEFKTYRKLSEFLEIEKKLNEFYNQNLYFNRPSCEIPKFTLEDCEKKEDILYKKRALALERFFNFVLLKEKHLIHPWILEFLDLSSEEKKPFLSYHNFLIKTRIIRNVRRFSKKPKSFNTLTQLDSPLCTENFEEDSQSSYSMIPMNYLLFEVKLLSIWKFPNEPLESNITMGITEKNINYDWEITRKFSDFIQLHMILKTKAFKDQQDFVVISQKLSPLIQLKNNTINYFFNFEVIKKDLIDYVAFLVTNSQFHCNEVFNFIEFDPNAMKRFIVGKNLTKYLAPTQTVRTFTNESHLGGGRYQHTSILSIVEPNGTEPNLLHVTSSSNNSNNLLKFKRANTSIKQGFYTRSYTERKNEGNFIDRSEVLRLQNFFANVDIRYLNDGNLAFVITLNEYFAEKINKVKRRIVFEKNKEEIKKLYDIVIGYCEQNHIIMSLPLRNIEVLSEENEEDVKNGIEIYLNEVIKIPSISKKKEVMMFFYFDKILTHFETNKEQEMMVLDFREK